MISICILFMYLYVHKCVCVFIFCTDEQMDEKEPSGPQNDVPVIEGKKNLKKTAANDSAVLT